MGGNQRQGSVTLDASRVTPGGNEQAVPNPPVLALEDRRRFIVPMKSLLALVAFVAVGSLGYVTFISTSSSVSNSAPVIGLEVGPTVQLQVQGDSGEYSLVVRNTGEHVIKDVRITEELPEDLEYVTSDPQPVMQQGPQVIVWQVADISEDEAITIRVTIRLRRDLKSGERITTKPTVIYANEEGEDKTVRFSVEPVIRGPSG